MLTSRKDFDYRCECTTWACTSCFNVFYPMELNNDREKDGTWTVPRQLIDRCPECGEQCIQLDIRAIDLFTQGYIDCALWASTDESTPQGGEPMDKNYDQGDLVPECLVNMIFDCKLFQEQNAEDLATYPVKIQDWTGAAQAGHDFWLTRHRHGTGFWDRDFLQEDVRQRLTEAAHKFGECNLCIGDDKTAVNGRMGLSSSETPTSSMQCRNSARI